MSTISNTGSLSSSGQAASPPPTQPYRLRGLGVAAGGLIVTGSGAALVHHFGTPDGTYVGEIVTEFVAAALGYLVAFGLGWWRPRRSAAVRTTAQRTALVLALVGALLVPVCYWNPMPLTFAASALLLLRWSRDAGTRRAGASRGSRSLELGVTVLSVTVIVVQLVVFVVHVAQSSAN